MRIQEPEKQTSDVIKTDDESSNEEKFVVKIETNKNSKTKKKVERLRFDCVGEASLESLNVSQQSLIQSAEFEEVSQPKDSNLIQVESGISEINYNFAADTSESVENVPLQFENASQDFLLNPTNPSEVLVSDPNRCFEDPTADAAAAYSGFPAYDSHLVTDPYHHHHQHHQEQLSQSDYQHYHYGQHTCDLSSEQQQPQHQYYYPQGYDYSDYYPAHWQFSSEHQMQSSDQTTATQYPYHTVAFE